jgi:hypothetical protein
MVEDRDSARQLRLRPGRRFANDGACSDPLAQSEKARDMSKRLRLSSTAAAIFILIVTSAYHHRRIEAQAPSALDPNLSVRTVASGFLMPISSRAKASCSAAPSGSEQTFRPAPTAPCMWCR